MQHRYILKLVISLKNIIKNERLYKVIAHEVSKILYIITELKLKLKMYNDIHLNQDSY